MHFRTFKPEMIPRSSQNCNCNTLPLITFNPPPKKKHNFVFYWVRRISTDEHPKWSPNRYNCFLDIHQQVLNGHFKEHIKITRIALAWSGPPDSVVSWHIASGTLLTAIVVHALITKTLSSPIIRKPTPNILHGLASEIKTSGSDWINYIITEAANPSYRTWPNVERSKFGDQNVPLYSLLRFFVALARIDSAIGLRVVIESFESQEVVERENLIAIGKPAQGSIGSSAIIVRNRKSRSTNRWG